MLLFSRLRAAAVPGFSVFELSVGDAADRLTDDEIRQYFERVLATMRRIAAVLGARYVDSPMWLKKRIITVHPVGGAPTFLGTLVGYQVNSQPLELLFYALAAGAVLYVIGEIWTGMRR